MTTRPNIMLVMCDDLGYGDTGFNGNELIRTPHLDALREEGARFTRFYAGGPVCSPTRGTCLTGRHYSRYGVTHANQGRLPTAEITLAGICKERGYRTGHFGKWHLGTLTKTEPGVVQPRSQIDTPCSTLDYLPTLAAEMGRQMPDRRPVDGVDIRPILRGEVSDRPRPIPFRFLETRRAMFGSPTLALIDGPWKFLTNLSEEGHEDMLFFLHDDRGEQHNCISENRPRAADMRRWLEEFIDSCRRSHHGADYPRPCPPVNEFQEPDGTWR